MSKIDNKLEHLEGKITETIGKVTNREDVELKGKLKSIKSDMMSKGEELKEKAQAKTNDLIDRIREEKDK